IDASTFVPAGTGPDAVAGAPAGAGGAYFQKYAYYQKMGMLDQAYQAWSGTSNPAPAANVWFHYAADQAALTTQLTGTPQGIYYVAGSVTNMGGTDQGKVTLVVA